MSELLLKNIGFGWSLFDWLNWIFTDGCCNFIEEINQICLWTILFGQLIGNVNLGGHWEEIVRFSLRSIIFDVQHLGIVVKESELVNLEWFYELLSGLELNIKVKFSLSDSSILWHFYMTSWAAASVALS